ncbi:hypothetical protein PG993_003818 [Apiospora rasikravindrae]|uniref:Uncharacterized protein n=1 Tax=Apiospora rasikravindrae TaxID=990691 RepID=A0ABR1U0U6_9PEZI
MLSPGEPRRRKQLRHQPLLLGPLAPRLLQFSAQLRLVPLTHARQKGRGPTHLVTTPMNLSPRRGHKVEHVVLLILLAIQMSSSSSSSNSSSTVASPPSPTYWRMEPPPGPFAQTICAFPTLILTSNLTQLAMTINRYCMKSLIRLSAKLLAAPGSEPPAAAAGICVSDDDEALKKSV